MVAPIISLISGMVLWLLFHFAWKTSEQNRRTTLTKTFEVNACCGSFVQHFIFVLFIRSLLKKNYFGIAKEFRDERKNLLSTFVNSFLKTLFAPPSQNQAM